MSTSTPYAPSVPRPVGVWILTILNVLISGIIPITTALAFFSIGEPRSFLDLAFGGVQGAFGCVIIWLSIGAWRGNDTARNRLLAVLITFHIIQIFSNTAILVFADVSAQFFSRFLGAIVRSLFWISINVWYFRRPQTKAWFQARHQLRSSV